MDNFEQITLFKMIKKYKLRNRRYLGNKHKLLDFIKYVVDQTCDEFNSFCDIFAGTGVVGDFFNNSKTTIISNDLLYSNFVCLNTFLNGSKINLNLLAKKINYLNSLKQGEDNYFSINFGNKYFTNKNAQKIGLVREEIENIAENEFEKMALISSLIYATDKIANTVGHYDAYRKNLDSVGEVKLLLPDIRIKKKNSNKVYCEDANNLITKIKCDILYLDPPYNSRQYSDTYHLLENLARWNKPPVFGKANKMNRSNLKSNYCFKNAAETFSDLINKAMCKHILVSYNNTGESKHGRSNARIKDEHLIKILEEKGRVKVFEKPHKAFTTGRSNTNGHTERIFYCKVNYCQKFGVSILQSEILKECKIY